MEDEELARSPWDDMNQFGFYGGVVIRHQLKNVGDRHDGHTHHIDHMSVINQGSVKISWRKYENPDDKNSPLIAFGEKDFTAPTFATIDANTCHEVIATSPDTIWMCVFGMPDGFGGDTSPLYSERNNPYV